jgi:hypothetical protein
MSEQPDIRQWAYGKWWTPITEENPEPVLLDPQPPPPTLDQLFDTRLIEDLD